jgi:hypothetical protein
MLFLSIFEWCTIYDVLLVAALRSLRCCSLATSKIKLSELTWRQHHVLVFACIANQVGLDGWPSTRLTTLAPLLLNTS